MKHKRFIAILFILAQMGVYGQRNPRETVTVGDDIFLPYLFDDGEIVRKAGSSVVFYFNDPRSLLGLPINSDLDDFYLSPVKIAEFMGYPIYMNERGEAIVIYKGREPLFLPVSQDEYLTALISAEAKKEKEHPQTVTVDDNLIEMELAYQQLLKMDKAAAADFKKEMDRFRKDASQSPETEQVASAYKKELARLSPAQRGSPRLYEPRHTVGFSLTDDRIYEMYNNQNLWKHIIDEVH